MLFRLMACLVFLLAGMPLRVCATVAPAGIIETATNGWVDVHMLDARNGWAEVHEGWRVVYGGHRIISISPLPQRLLHTSDGARTWSDVTPRPFPHRDWHCQFPKPNLAWISYYETNTFLVLTTNAGRSWMPWKPLGPFDNSIHNFFLGGEESHCRFFNDHDGLAIMVDVGACQAEYTFFETHDGGLSWTFAPFRSTPSAPSGLPNGTVHIGDCDGSAVSYDPPRTVVIAEGDLMDETAKGIVRFCVSTNAGSTWRDLAFPLPAQYQDRLVESSPPWFFDARRAIMGVRLVRDTPRGLVDPVLVLYSTSDGGLTWRTAGGAIPVGTEGYNDFFDYVSPRDVFIHAGVLLYATHDGGRNWLTIRPDINFGKIVQMHFEDARHGWAVLRSVAQAGAHDDYSFAIERTSNGGRNWRPIPAKAVN